ncbi:glycosyltransferase family protein [Jatrophihabitans fulvus]
MTGTSNSSGIALVVVNYASDRLVERNLGWAGPTSFPVVLVDNFESRASSQRAAALVSERGWNLVASPTNVGFGIGVNLGVRRAFELGMHSVVVVNPDVRLTRRDVEALVGVVAADPDVLAAPVVLDPTGRTWGSLGRLDVRIGRVHTTDRHDGPAWVSGACFAVGRTLWERIGGMDTDYFMYWEDVDLSIRVQHVGGRVRSLKDVQVVHDVGGTQGGGGYKSQAYYYYNCRNRLVFAAKHLTAPGVMRWIVHTPSDVRRVISRGTPRPLPAKVRSALLPALRGCAAGLWFWARPARARGTQ